jgi:hypothetical protein
MTPSTDDFPTLCVIVDSDPEALKLARTHFMADAGGRKRRRRRGGGGVGAGGPPPPPPPPRGVRGLLSVVVAIVALVPVQGVAGIRLPPLSALAAAPTSSSSSSSSSQPSAANLPVRVKPYETWNGGAPSGDLLQEAAEEPSFQFFPRREQIQLPCQARIASPRDNSLVSEVVGARGVSEIAGDSGQLALLGEFAIPRPAYVQVLDSGRVRISQFGLTSKASVSTLGVDDEGKLQAQVLTGAMQWPNEVSSVALSELMRSSTSAREGEPATNEGDAMLIADGFIIRADGGVYIAVEGQEPVRVTAEKRSWFYHKAVWVDLPKGRKGILTARAYKPLFGTGKGQLVLLEMPGVRNPLASYSLPWRETVLCQGPDVMFEVVDLDPTDSTVEIMCAEFFSKRLTMHSVNWGDAVEEIPARVMRSWVLDDRCGPAYSIRVADLKGSGKPTHVLVTSHEGDFDYHQPMHSSAPPSNAAENGKDAGTGGALYAYEIPRQWKVYPFVYPRPGWRRITIVNGFKVRGLGINPGAPGFCYIFHARRPTPEVPRPRPYIAIAGDCSQAAYILKPSGAEDAAPTDYELICTLGMDGTVGSLGIGQGHVLGLQGEGDMDQDATTILVPNFDKGRIYVFQFTP